MSAAAASTWTTARFGEVLKPRYGKALPADRRHSTARYPVVGSAGVMTATDDPLVRDPVVVIGRKGNVGEVRFMEDGCWPIDTTYYVEVPNGLDARYLTHYLRHLDLKRFDSSTATPSLRRQDLEAQLLRFPDLAEQRRIVEILEDHLSHLDAAQTSLQEACSRLEAMRASALDARVVGPMVPLGDVAVERGYGTSTKCVVDGPGLPVARIPNLVRGRLDMSDEKRAASLEDDLSHLLVRRGDLLIIRTNGSRALIGRAALIEQDAEIAFASYLIRYRLDSTRMSPAWALAALESPRIREAIEAAAASSAGQHNLSIAKLDALQVPCPDIKDQVDALAWLEGIDADAWRLNQAIGNLASRASNLRRATLAAAFEGKLTGRHTDADVIEEMAVV